jgi:hypothetical protein
LRLLCPAFFAGLAIACSTPAPPPAGRALKNPTDVEATLPARLGHEVTSGVRGSQQPKVAVDSGDPGEAASYYAQLQSDLGASLTTFNQVLHYFGYPGLRGADLESLDPSILMDPSALAAAVMQDDFKRAVALAPLVADDVLSTRFFAPGITGAPGQSGKTKPGWRKLVRLRARHGSPAHAKGLASAWLLFNIFPNDARAFEGRSSTSQVMLIRADGVTSLKPAYWMVFAAFDNASGDGGRIDHINASFDHRHPALVSGNKYYLPQACADCHGGLSGGEPAYDRAALNYLDTDHWIERSRDDFKTIDPMLGVLVDGGPDTTTEQYKRAFRVIYTLNTEIRAQNAETNGPGSDRVQLRAVDRWLHAHDGNVQFVPFDRNTAAATCPAQ